MTKLIWDKNSKDKEIGTIGCPWQLSKVNFHFIQSCDAHNRQVNKTLNL